MRIDFGAGWRPCCCWLRFGTAWAPTPASTVHDPYLERRRPTPRSLDGEMLWGRNIDVRRAPASLTKLLTALVRARFDWHPERDADRQP